MDFYCCSNNSIMSELYCKDCKDCSVHIGETQSKQGGGGNKTKVGSGKGIRDFVSEADIYISGQQSTTLWCCFLI